MSASPSFVVALDPAPRALQPCADHLRTGFADHLEGKLSLLVHPLLATARNPAERNAALLGLADALAATLAEAVLAGRSRAAGEAASRALSRALIEGIRDQVEPLCARPAAWTLPAGERA
jgi:hypothetical protein